MLTPAEDHYAKHVLQVPEWPLDTGFEQYLESIRQVLLDPTGGVFLSRYRGILQVGFIRRSGRSRGPEGRAWILVEHNVDTGRWVTAFQLRSLADLERPERSDLRWLKLPD